MGGDITGKSASSITRHIANEQAMQHLDFLTDTQIDILEETIEEKVVAIDGDAVYLAKCDGCHKNGSKKGRPADAILGAISANRGGMGFIQLSSEEAQAISEL